MHLIKEHEIWDRHKLGSTFAIQRKKYHLRFKLPNKNTFKISTNQYNSKEIISKKI